MKDRTLDLPVAGVGTVDIDDTRRPAAGKAMRILLLSFFVALTTAAQNCNSETLFKSNLDATAFNDPPSANQAVGTAHTHGVPGSVLVVPAPPDAAPPAKWLRIMRPTGPGEGSVFSGRLKRRPGNGTYVFTTGLVIPDGNNGPASIQFEALTGDPFLRIDVMPDGRVLIDHFPKITVGTFARNQVFVVQVTLIVSDTSAKARVVLSGAGASGQADHSITIPPLVTLAQQFEAVSLSMGFLSAGTFHAANVVVTRKS